MPVNSNNKAWEGFRTGEWRHLVNVRNFIQKNYTPYTGESSAASDVYKRQRKRSGKKPMP